MRILFPPWAIDKKETKGVPLWSVKERHIWMCKTLQIRRGIQAVKSNDTIIGLYNHLMSEFFNNFRLENEKTVILEIISDGLGAIEPHWHGLEININNLNNEIALLPRFRHEDFIESVKKQRKKYELQIPTHRDIGQKLLEPTLFKILKNRKGNSVLYFRHGEWVALENLDSQLPIILSTAEDGITQDWSSLSQFNSNIKTLHDLTEYKDTLKLIKNSLFHISKNVLWPSFFPDKGENANFMSLVLIHASTWQVPGVWALHVCSENGVIKNNKTGNISPIVDPAVFCLNDALGATFIRDSKNEIREKDVELFNRAKGIYRKSPKEFYENTPEDEIIYEYPTLEDPFNRFGNIYNLACEYHTGEKKKSIPSEENILLIDRALEQTFISWGFQESSPRFAHIVIRDSLKLCLTILESVKIAEGSQYYSLHCRLIGSQLVKKAMLCQKTFNETTSPFNDRQNLLGILSIALVSVAVDISENVSEKGNEWLSRCGNGLLANYLSYQKNSENFFPAITDYSEWETSSKTHSEYQHLEECLTKIGLKEDAVFLMIEFIQWIDEEK